MNGEIVSRDPFEVLDPRFRRLILPIVWLERLAGDQRWAEGPVWFADMRCLLWSDIPNNRMMRWCEESGAVTVFRADSNFANGNTRDRAGRLVTCEHRTRRLTRTEADGSITVLADRFEGRRLNAPNDVVVRSDGTIWFTDPTFGIEALYEGAKAEPEQAACNVFRLDPSSNVLSVATAGLRRPNGLAFSPDERFLYVADSGFNARPDWPHEIRRFAVAADGDLADETMFAVVTPPIPDGIRVDAAGNVWSSAGDGVHCYAPDGALIGKIRVPEKVGNLTFGGRDRNRLFICGHTSIYSIFLNTEGAGRP